MSKNLTRRVLSAVLALVFVLGMLYVPAKVNAAEGGSEKLLDAIIREIAADEAGRKSALLDAAGEKVADIEISGGTVDAPVAPTGYASDKVTCGSIGVSTWEFSGGSSFLKLTVAKDAVLRFQNPEFTGTSWYTWTKVNITKVSGETKTDIFTSAQVNASEGAAEITWAEGDFYNQDVEVKAGDVVYFSVIGNEWGALLRAAAFRVEVLAAEPAEPVESAEALKPLKKIIEDIAAGKLSILTDAEGKAVAGIELLWGTMGSDEKAMTVENDHKLTYGDKGGFMDSGDTWKDYLDGFVKITVQQDAKLHFYNDAFTCNRWASYGAISITRNGEKLYTTARSGDGAEGGTPWEAKAWIDASIEVKAGDVLYVHFDDSVANGGIGQWGIYLPVAFLNLEVEASASGQPTIPEGPFSGADVLAGIYANEADRTYNAGSALFTVGYGIIGSEEHAFANYENETFFQTSGGGKWWFISSSADSQYNYWQAQGGESTQSVFMKLVAAEDCSLTLGHDAVTNPEGWGNNAGYDFDIQVIKNGVVVSSVNSQGGYQFAENHFFADLEPIGLKAGDVVYVAMTGDWSAHTHFNPTFEFGEPIVEEADPNYNIGVSNGDIMANIFANTADRTYAVKNGEAVLGVFTAGYGHIGLDEKAFATYESASFFNTTDGANGVYWFISSSPDSRWHYWKAAGTAEAADVFLRLDVKADGYVGIGHDAISNEKACTEGTDFDAVVILIRDGKTYVLSSVYSGLNKDFAANSLVNFSGNVKAGDTLYVGIRGNYDAATHFNPNFTFMPTQDNVPETGYEMELLPIFGLLAAAACLVVLVSRKRSAR